MKPSIIWADAIKKIFSALFWLAVWQAVSMLMGKEVLLASPKATFNALARIITAPGFLKTLSFSLGRIAAGFGLGLTIGVVLAALAARSDMVKELIALPIGVAKCVPVASFVILALLWVSGRNLSTLVSFLMALPVVYSNMRRGFENVDRGLLEMAKVFRLGAGKTFLYVYLPRLMPFFTSACVSSLGLCWKSGVAAEVIGLPRGSVGNRLYETKLYLDTPAVFAWTAVIIAVSFLSEKILVRAIRRANEKIRKGFL